MNEWIMKDLPYLRSINLGYSVFCGTRKNSILVSMKGINVFDWLIESIELPSLEQLQTDRYSFYYASVANFESMIEGWCFHIDLSSLHFVSLRDSFKKCEIVMNGEWFEWMIICRCIKWIACCFSMMLVFVGDLNEHDFDSMCWRYLFFTIIWTIVESRKWVVDIEWTNTLWIYRTDITIIVIVEMRKWLNQS